MRHPFVFLDESGTADSHKNPQPYFGVGFLKVENPTELSKRLLNIGCNAKSKAVQKRRSLELREKLLSGKLNNSELNFFLQNSRHHEYHFAEVNTEISEDYIKFIDTFFHYKFHFCAIIIDKKLVGSRYRGYWDSYVNIAKLICDKNLRSGEKATIIADYMNAPKSSNLSLENELLSLGKINNVIRLQSNGVPLLQICDLFLGATVFAHKVTNKHQNLNSDYSKAKNHIVNYLQEKLGGNSLSNNFTYNDKNTCYFSVWKIK
jgi:hypothetical protein